MTESIFDKCIAHSQRIERYFRESGELIEVDKNERLGITDLVFSSMRYRRAHISIVDARDTKGVWLLHCTIFPHYNDSSPIYGFDIVAGSKKVSGAFHDYSISGDPTSPLWLWFNAKTAVLDWNKKRELPVWAKQIFSKAMVAIGAVGEEELDKFIELGHDTLKFYLNNIGLEQESGADFHMAQDRYCYYQRQNPHTPRVLVNLGFSEKEAIEFVERNLFPFSK